jgi:hypothetical protein
VVTAEAETADRIRRTEKHVSPSRVKWGVFRGTASVGLSYGSARGGKVIEAIERSVGGDEVQAVLCGCERCPYLWLVPMERGAPARCSRCKSRTRAGSTDSEVERPVAIRPDADGSN